MNFICRTPQFISNLIQGEVNQFNLYVRDVDGNSLKQNLKIILAVSVISLAIFHSFSIIVPLTALSILTSTF